MSVYMNRTLKIASAVVLTLMLASISGFAQQQRQNQAPAAANAWRDRMRSEMIAFYTSEIGLTPAEAQVFWPVHNQAEQEQMKLIQKVGEAYMALEKALDSKASESEIEAKLQAYNKAIDARNQFDASLMTRYGKVLSKEKIARLYVAEEKFRRNQIHRLHAPGVPGNPPQAGGRQAQR